MGTIIILSYPLIASRPSPAEVLHGRLCTSLPSTRPAAQSEDTLEAQSCCQQLHAKATSSTQLPPLQQGKVLPCIITMDVHGSTLLFPKCCRPPPPRSYQLSSNYGGAYRRTGARLRQQCLIVLHHHITSIVLYITRVYHLHTLVVIPVVLMSHNHKMDLLMMDNMLLVMDLYRNQPPDISSDKGYEHYDEQCYYCYVYINLIRNFRQLQYIYIYNFFLKEGCFNIDPLSQY